MDDDTAGVLLTESDGDTVVVKNAPPITPDEQDSYTLRLTKAPEAAVRINLLTDGQTDVVLGGRVTLEELAETSFSGSVTFAANVPGGAPADPDAIIRTGGGSWLAEGFLEGQTIRVKVGAATADFKIERIGGTAEGLNDILRLRAVDNLGGLGYGLKTAEIVRLVAQASFDSTNWHDDLTITVQADLNFEVGPDRQNVKEFAVQPHLLSELRGPLSVEGGVSGADRSLVQAILLPKEANAPFLGIGEQPPENQNIDVLNIFDDSSQEDKVGVLTSTQLTGFGLPDELDFGIENVLGEPGTYPGGITFGKVTFDPKTGIFETSGDETTIEVLNLMLGSGNDTLTINGTLKGAAEDDGNPLTADAPALHGGLTLAQGGGGDDHIIATGGGGPDSVLVVYGDTSQDGVWYSGAAETVDGRQFGPKAHDAFPNIPDEDEFWEFPVANAFDNFGRDVIDARNLFAGVPPERCSERGAHHLRRRRRTTPSTAARRATTSPAARVTTDLRPARHRPYLRGFGRQRRRADTPPDDPDRQPERVLARRSAGRGAGHDPWRRRRQRSWAARRLRRLHFRRPRRDHAGRC